MKIVRCSHCGMTNRSGSNFCNRCGAALQEGKQPVDSAPTEQGNQIEEENLHNPNPQDTFADTPAKNEPRATVDDQPLRNEIDHNIDRAYTTSEDSSDTEQYDDHSARLVTGIQGLLDPIRIASDQNAETLDEQRLFTAPPLAVSANRLRRIRTLVTEDPTLIEEPTQIRALQQIRLRLPWLIVLLLAAVGLPVLLLFTAPVGTPRQWPGVTEAHATIDALPNDAIVWMFWAYDPATAGEMDLVALPLATHLIERNVQTHLVSLLPTGLATADRLWRSAQAEALASNRFGSSTGGIDHLQGAYLPGGAPALALLATSPSTALIGHTSRAANLLPFVVNRRPALSIVLAAEVEDVQHWLELVQPDTQIPVVAFTSAGAAPLLQPYLASGQLRGLVSGFDGAMAYQEQRGRRFTRAEDLRFTQQLIAQNWGHFALLIILILGNLSALWGGGQNG